MSELWADGQRPRWIYEDGQWVRNPEECGTWNAVFWITVGALVGLVVGLVAWKLWGGE